MAEDDRVSNDVLDAAQRLQEFCRAKGWRFCFIGGLAVQQWSEPRVTDDVDVTLITGFGTEDPFIDALLALDWHYIREQLVPLLALKEQPYLLDQLEDLRVRLRQLDEKYRGKFQ